MVHLVPLKEQYPEFQQAILGFVVPLFLFVTGYLVNIDKTKVQFTKYLLGILVPYVVMELFYILVAQFVSVNNVPGIDSLQDIIMVLVVNPVGPYWYLHSMLICGTVYYVVFLWFHSCRLYVFVSALLAIAFFTPLLNVGVAMAYFAGVLVRKSKIEFERIFPTTPFAFFVIVLTMAYSMCVSRNFASWYTLYPVVMSVSMISALLWLQKYACKWQFVDFVGKNTLPIFLFHPIFTMLAKTFFACFALSNSCLIIYTVLTVVVSVIGSLAIAYILDTTRLSLFFCRGRIIR